MKRIVVLLWILVFGVALVFVSSDMVFTQDEETEEAQEPIHAFKDAEKMAEFEQLYVAKQATFGRMGVLQAYFTMEQSNLTEIDRQMEEKFGFKMDVNKMYDLDRDAMEIKEAGPVPAVAPMIPAAE
ncbi:hypothetical protein ACFL28_01230 [Candidatus Omnitrophota bacterium]